MKVRLEDGYAFSLSFINLALECAIRKAQDNKEDWN
jgi:hypothetical protein